MDNLKDKIRSELRILEKMIDENCDRELIENQKEMLKSLLCEYVKDL